MKQLRLIRLYAYYYCTLTKEVDELSKVKNDYIDERISYNRALNQYISLRRFITQRYQLCRNLARMLEWKETPKLDELCREIAFLSDWFVS